MVLAAICTMCAIIVLATAASLMASERGPIAVALAMLLVLVLGFDAGVITGAVVM